MERIKIKLNKVEDIQHFIKLANSFESDVNVYKGSYILDGKSLLGLMSLDLTQTIEVELISGNAMDIQTFISVMRQFEV